jgi:glutaredoxin-related protein
MEDRLAQMKASQRETLEKMRQLEQENSNDANAVSNHDDSHTCTENTASSSIVKVSDGTLKRYILGESLIHPAIRNHIAGNHRDIVEEVMDAISRERVVVIGMSGNPFVSKTKKLLNALGIDYAYLQYGSYFSQWRRRNALKMWTGWPTFPMIFINGKLVGGYQNLKILSDFEELQRLAKE